MTGGSERRMSSHKISLAERRPPAEVLGGFDLENAALSKLRSLAQVQRLRRRQRFTLFGTEHIYLIRSGLMAIEGAPAAGKRSILELLYPGDLLVPGLQAPIPDLALTATTAAEIWRISSHAFMHEQHRDPQLAELVFQRLNTQRARVQLHVAVLAGLASEQRVAALLIEAACRLGVNDGKSLAFDMPLSRTEVAEYLALNADTLSRIMSRFTQSQILERSGRAQMAVRDWDALVAHCPLAGSIIALHKP